MSIVYHQNAKRISMIIRSTVTTDSSQPTFNDTSGAAAAPASADTDTEQNTGSSAHEVKFDDEEDRFNLVPKSTRTQRYAPFGRGASAFPAKDKNKKKKKKKTKETEEEEVDIFNLVPRSQFNLPLCSNSLQQQQQQQQNQKQCLNPSRREWRPKHPDSGMSREEISQAEANLFLLSDEICSNSTDAPSMARRESLPHSKRVAAASSSNGVMHWSIEISESTSNKTPIATSPGDALWKFTNRTPPKPPVTLPDEATMILANNWTWSTSATTAASASSAAAVELEDDRLTGALEEAGAAMEQLPDADAARNATCSRSESRCIEISRSESHRGCVEHTALHNITESLPTLKVAPSASVPQAVEVAPVAVESGLGSKAATAVVATQPELVGCSDSIDTSGRSASQEDELYATLSLLKPRDVAPPSAPPIRSKATRRPSSKERRELTKAPRHSMSSMLPNSETVRQQKPSSQRSVVQQEGKPQSPEEPLSHHGEKTVSSQASKKATHRRSKSSTVNLKDTKLTEIDEAAAPGKVKATPLNPTKKTQEPDTKTSLSDAKRKPKASQRKTSRSSRDPSKDSAPNATARVRPTASPMKRLHNPDFGRSRFDKGRACSASSAKWTDPPDSTEKKPSVQQQPLNLQGLQEQPQPQQKQQEALNKLLNQASSEEASYVRDLCSGSEEAALASRQNREHNSSSQQPQPPIFSVLDQPTTDQHADKDPPAIKSLASSKDRRRHSSLSRDRSILPTPRKPSWYLSISSRNNIHGPVELPWPHSQPQPLPTLERDFIAPSGRLQSILQRHQIINSESNSTVTMSASHSLLTELRLKSQLLSGCPTSTLRRNLKQRRQLQAPPRGSSPSAVAKEPLPAMQWDNLVELTSEMEDPVK